MSTPNQPSPGLHTISPGNYDLILPNSKGGVAKIYSYRNGRLAAIGIGDPDLPRSSRTSNNPEPDAKPPR